MRKKTALSIAALSLLVAALAAPAPASAEGWTHEGVPLEEAQEKKDFFTGPWGIITPLGSASCVIHLKALLGGPIKNLLKGAVITWKTCKFTGALTGCETVEEESEGTGLPWEMHVTGEQTLLTTNVEFDYEFSGECPIGEMRATFPEVTATPDNPESISSVSLSGEGIIDVLGMEVEAEVEGTLPASPAGTYGIE